MKTSFKTLFGTLTLLMLFITTLFGQSETVSVDITKLSTTELQAYQTLKQKQVEASKILNINNLTPDNIDKYAQVGKAFGSAFKECWSTVATDAEKFGQSDAGKLTMVLIAWKIMGNDAVNLVEKTVQYAIGLPLLFIGTFFFIFIMRRNCFERPILVSTTKLGWFTTKNEYKGTSSAVWDGEQAAICCLFYAIFIGICSTIIFVG